MQVFKTDRKVFWTNELKSWLLNFAFVAVLYFCLRYFSLLSGDDRVGGIVVILLLKIAETLTPYHVTEIGIDSRRNQLTFKLYSVLSGQKFKKYQLEGVSSELIYHSGVAKLLSSPMTLKVFLTPQDTFRINSRYGFSTNTLAGVDHILKTSSTSLTTQ